MKYNTMIEKIGNAQKIIDEYKESGIFDPYNFLTGTLSKDDRLFNAAIDLLSEVEKQVAIYEAAKKDILFH